MTWVPPYEMPEAPVAESKRGQPMDHGAWVRGSIGFALFAVSILTVVYAFGLLTDGLLIQYDPDLEKRHAAFESLTGFDNVTTDGTGVEVCMVDSGIDMGHPDLADIELGGWKDFVNDRGTPYDDQTHGTAMAGILIANGMLPGQAQGIVLHVAKAITRTGSGSEGDIADAIDWCVAQGTDIISLSLGGSQGLDLIIFETDAVEAAVNDALDAGVFVVAAAGNDGGQNDDGDVASPASVEDVICVGAVDTDGGIWANSSKGSNGLQVFPPRLPRSDPDRKPELVAPVEKLPLLNPASGGESRYAWGSGTSGATVWVTAAVAHLLENRPDLMHDGTSGGRGAVGDVKTWIKDSVVEHPDQNGHDDLYGYGVLRVDALLAAASQG